MAEQKPATTPAQIATPWVFVNEGLRAPLAAAIADFKPEGNPDAVQLAAVAADAVAQLNSLPAVFNGARVQIECQANAVSRQSTIIIQGRKFLA